MQVLLAVIDDLWRFAFSSLFGYRTVTLLDKEREVQSSLPFLPPTNQDLLDLPETPQISELEEVFRPGEHYFVGELETYIYSDPVIAFDTAMRKVSYGQPVLVKKVGGRWAEISINNESGWLLKDVLREKREDVYPQFVEGAIYDESNRETVKLRSFINDEFGGARAGLVLSPAEFVSYCLALQHKFIQWPHDGPRVPGTWQRRLRGQTGIHIGIQPVTNSVMEYIIDDIGYLAFVEAVFPDKSIKVNQVGIPEEGQYTERVMTREEYRELAPVFIEVV